jgi:E3 ubiquitin-protein ligase BRE1
VLIFITHAHDAQAFRKEAIYREMLSYKRQLARAHSETEKLRSQRLAYQVRVSRVEQEWSALVAEANLRLPSTSTSSTLDATGDEGAGADSDSLELDVDVDAILLGASDEDLDEVLARRSTATKALLERLQSLQPAATTQAPSELEQRCAELGAQALAAREHLRILRAEHAETVDRLEETHARLVRVERKFDRMQSRTVAELEGRPDPAAVAAASAAATASGSGVAAERRGSGTPGVAAEGGRGSPLVAANGATSTSVAPQAGSSGGAGPDADDAAAAAAEASREIESLRDAVKRRGNEIEELRSERVALKNEIDQLKVKVRQ